MMNKSELQTLIKEYLNRPNLKQEVINMWLSATEGELMRALYEHPKHRRIIYFENAEDVPLSIVELPNDVAKLQQVMHSDDERLEQYPISFLPLKCRGFVYTGNSLHLYPALNPRHKVTVVYHRFLPPLVSGIDYNWISQFHGDLYLYGALKEAAIYLKDDQRVVLWTQEFTRRIQELKMQGWSEEYQAAPAVRLQ